MNFCYLILWVPMLNCAYQCTIFTLLDHINTKRHLLYIGTVFLLFPPFSDSGKEGQDRIHPPCVCTRYQGFLEGIFLFQIPQHNHINLMNQLLEFNIFGIITQTLVGDVVCIPTFSDIFMLFFLVSAGILLMLHPCMNKNQSWRYRA